MKRKKISWNNDRGAPPAITFEDGLMFNEPGIAYLQVTQEKSNAAGISVRVQVPNIGHGFTFGDHLPLADLLEACDIDFLSYAKTATDKTGDLSSAFVVGLEQALNVVGKIRFFKEGDGVRGELAVGDRRITCDAGENWRRYFAQSPTP